MRQKALEDIFTDLQKAKKGNHSTNTSGKGDDYTSDLRPYEFGDKLDSLAVSESLRNAQINHGIDDFQLNHSDLEVRETYYQSQMSTVLMIYHTNTVAGLDLAMDILRKRRNPNKQIFMITDGKPTCIKKGKKYYKNSFGLDKKIIARTLNLATRCRKSNIPITTFMIARDPYLKRFVEESFKYSYNKTSSNFVIFVV